jgi:HEAT repeat protein
MLLMKAGLGDPDPRVTAECLEGLGRLATPRAIEALEGFLEDEAGPVAEAAALALGQTRTPEALERLIELRRACADRDRRKALLFPIALVRSEAAFDYLLSVLQREDADGAAAALEALEVFLGGEDRRAQVTAAVEERGEPALLRGLSEMNA